MSEALLERLRPLWLEALQAFLADPSYSVEMARAARLAGRASQR